MLPNIMVHGGAWYWDDSLDQVKKNGIEEAMRAGWAVLNKGGRALDAVEAAVVNLENNPVFDAGTGGYLNQEGVVELDAMIVDGRTREYAGVACVTRVKNPVVLARRIMEQTPYCFFAGEGANQMARQLGLPLVQNSALVTQAMRQYFEQRQQTGGADTVGAVAIDAQGNLAAGTSTSGSPFKPPGRVGDSPVLGAGGYAENGVGAAGATGLGENSLRVLLSKAACDRLVAGYRAPEAAVSAMDHVGSVFEQSMSGVIVLDRWGNPGAAHTTPKMAVGWLNGRGEIMSAIKVDNNHDLSSFKR